MELRPHVSFIYPAHIYSMLIDTLARADVLSSLGKQPFGWMAMYENIC